MMKYLVLALAITAISAQDYTSNDETIDDFLEDSMGLPCTPKPCVPVCKPTTKYMTFGAFKLPYTENVCKPDHKCLAAAAACIKTLQAAMKDAAAKEAALKKAAAAKNKAGASKAAKDKAAAAKKAEAAAAKKTLDLAKAEFVISEKEAATAKAAQVAADKHWKAKDSAMKKALAAYEKEKKNHLSAVAAYEGAKSAAAKAAAAYAAAVKAHCTAEAQHAAAVRNIGHGHLAQKNCAKHAPSFKIKYSKKWPHCHNVKCMHGTTKSMQAECLKHKSCTGFSFTHGKSHGSGCLKKCGSREFGGYGRGSHDYWARQ
jgi:hypothetical protein